MNRVFRFLTKHIPETKTEMRLRSYYWTVRLWLWRKTRSLVNSLIHRKYVRFWLALLMILAMFLLCFSPLVVSIMLLRLLGDVHDFILIFWLFVFSVPLQALGYFLAKFYKRLYLCHKAYRDCVRHICAESRNKAIIWEDAGVLMRRMGNPSQKTSGEKQG